MITWEQIITIYVNQLSEEKITLVELENRLSAVYDADTLNKVMNAISTRLEVAKLMENRSAN